jgi:hypothetical protein
MRTATVVRLLLVPGALLASACDDSSNPIAPEEIPVAEVEAPAPEPATGPLEDLAYWADGYLRSSDKLASSSTPVPDRSFNRSGGAITITRVAGTTGRYVARFGSLSALLGGRSTVRVTASGDDNSYCKPVGASLVRDSVEVRCFRMGTGTAMNALFDLTVAGKRDNWAFAFANQPTATNYAPASAGSWNPAGASRIYRNGVGRYLVVFAGLGSRLAPGVGGHVQVNAVSTGKAYCKVEEWAGSPDLSVSVGCYTPAGALADSKFTVLFTPPAAHLAYAWADSPTTAQYQAYSVYGSNPVGGAITIRRFGVGQYSVIWTGVDAEITGYGNVQVQAYGGDGAQCKLQGTLQNDGTPLRCYAPNGTLVDARYVVMLHS